MNKLFIRLGMTEYFILLLFLIVLAMIFHGQMAKHIPLMYDDTSNMGFNSEGN